MLIIELHFCLHFDHCVNCPSVLNICFHGDFVGQAY